MVTGSVLAASDGDAGAADVPPAGDAATVAGGGADDAAGVELPEHAATIAARATAARSRAGAVLRTGPFTMTFLLLVFRSRRWTCPTARLPTWLEEPQHAVPVERMCACD
jgi:hypothetical protein